MAIDASMSVANALNRQGRSQLAIDVILPESGNLTCVRSGQTALLCCYGGAHAQSTRLVLRRCIIRLGRSSSLLELHSVSQNNPAQLPPQHEASDQPSGRFTQQWVLRHAGWSLTHGQAVLLPKAHANHLR